jgi:hypothetical protein
VKALLTITAAVEAATGVAFVVTPSSVVLMLVGSPLDSPAGVIIARVLGAALLSLAAACWLARRDVHSRAAAGVIAAMLLYNIAVASLLVAARFGSGMSGAGLQPKKEFARHQTKSAQSPVRPMTAEIIATVILNGY